MKEYKTYAEAVKYRKRDELMIINKNKMFQNKRIKIHCPFYRNEEIEKRRSSVRNKRRIFVSIIHLKKAQDKRILAWAMRKWVEDTKKIHALNYWYYRWFTNDFELYILNSLMNGKEKQDG